MEKWTVKRVVCLILVSPLLLLLAAILSPFALIYGVAEGVNWILSTAFGFEYSSLLLRESE